VIESLFDETPTADGVGFRVEYEGPEFQGEMSARLMADVLGAMADYADSVVRAASDGEVKSTLKVQATETGSFDIVAFIVANWGVIGGGGGTLSLGGLAFGFWWKNMRKAVVEYEVLSDGSVRVTMRDGEVMEWTAAQWKLWNDKRARRALGRILEPLDKGATEVRAELGGEEPLVVTPADVDGLRPEIFEEDKVEHHTVWATPTVVAFDPSGAWRLDTESGGIKPRIEDKKFLSDVAFGRVRVGRNDRFHLAVRHEWTEDLDGEASNSRTYIERVILHIPGAEQDELPTGDGPAAD